MRRVLAFCVALALFGTFVLGLQAHWRHVVASAADHYAYDNTDLRNSCVDAFAALDDHNIVVLGSSELGSTDDLAYPPALFNGGNADFNMVLDGRGYVQSLQHAINVGAMADYLPKRKVVLILSPQWFQADMEAKAFPDRFLERNYTRFLANERVPFPTKAAVAARVESLLVDDPDELACVRLYNRTYLRGDHDPTEWIRASVRDSFMEQQTLYDFATEVESLAEPSGERVAVGSIDWDALLDEAQRAGEAACTNNEFGIYDEYYDTYIREGVEAGTTEGVSRGVSMAVSSEWDDLDLFLDVCAACEVEPLVVSIPCNGRWYNYAGVTTEVRQAYYQRVRDVCAKRGVSLADFADKEYELYFLRDAMHLGWRGWVYVDKAVYEFWRD